MPRGSVLEAAVEKSCNHPCKCIRTGRAEFTGGGQSSCSDVKFYRWKLRLFSIDKSNSFTRLSLDIVTCQSNVVQLLPPIPVIPEGNSSTASQKFAQRGWPLDNEKPVMDHPNVTFSQRLGLEACCFWALWFDEPLAGERRYRCAASEAAVHIWVASARGIVV